MEKESDIIEPLRADGAGPAHVAGAADAAACADAAGVACDADAPACDAGGVQTLSLTVSYDGAPFCGFARQPGQCTVQGELEAALRLLFKREVETTCAGRTDAGVHALGQVVSFDVAAAEMEGRSARRMLRSLNALTHDGITVRAVEPRTPGFSARFDALSREYRYHLCIDDAAPIFTGRFAWHVPGGLDIDAMDAGARFLIGEHDFKSFCMAVSAVGKPTCRNVSEISFTPETVMGEHLVTVKVVGNAFLHSMVRTIVGTLVVVGRGQRSPEWVREALEARDRRAAGETAPARGLVFWQVRYE